MSDQTFQIAIEFLQKGNVNGAIAELNKLKGAAGDAGAKSGEHSADQFSQRFEHKLKHHMANMAGKLAGVPGVGGLIAGFGVAGAAASVGFGLLEHAIDAVIEKHKKLKEETAALAEVQKQLRDVGLDEKLIQPMTKHVEQLAKAMGTDLKAAGAVARAELAGDFTALAKLGIVILDDVSRAEQLRLAFDALAGAGERDFFAIENAAKLAAAEIAGIKKAADDATEALQKTLEQIKRNMAAFARSQGDKEGADIAEINAGVAEGKLTRGDADQKIAALKKKNAEARFGAEYATAQTQIGKYKEAISGEKHGMAESQADITERERIFALNVELRKRQRVTKEIEGQSKGVVESGFGKGKTEAEYRAFLATLPAWQSEEKVGQLDELAQRRAAAQGAEREIHEQIPAGRTDINAEAAALNKLGPEVVKSQNEAYRRINEYLEKINELEASVTDAQKAHEAEMRKLIAEGRTHAANARSADAERAGEIIQAGKDPSTDPQLKKYFDPKRFRGGMRTDPVTGKIILPEEITPPAARAFQGPPSPPLDFLGPPNPNSDAEKAKRNRRAWEMKEMEERWGRQWKREGFDNERGLETPDRPGMSPRGGYPLPAIGAGPAVQAANRLGESTKDGFKEIASVLDTHAAEIKRIAMQIGGSGPKVYSP